MLGDILADQRCAGLGWAMACGRAGSPLAVAEVLAQWLEAHRRQSSVACTVA